jgi:hypothetical protein
MKNAIKIFALTLLVCLMAGTSQLNAQAKFGPIVGLNLADVSGDVNSDGMIIGAHLGGFVNLGITENFMVEPQLLFSMKGAKGSGDDLRMNWIEVPIWARYELASGLNFSAGPFVGILLSADAGQDVKDSFKSTDFGLGFGVGYQMEGGLGFHLNYSAGLANIGEDISVTVPFVGTITQEVDAKTSCIKISVSYMLGGRRN